MTDAARSARRRWTRRLSLALGVVVAAATAWWLDVGGLRGGGFTTEAIATAERTTEVRVPAEPAAVRWLPEHVAEGTVFIIVVEGGAPRVQAVTGRFGGEPLHFREEAAGVLVALAAAPLDSAGPRELGLEITHVDGSRETRSTAVGVAAGEYRMERLSVAPRFGQPQPAELQRRTADEAARARAVSARSHATPRMWELPIVAPRESRITSGFGHGRTFNGQVQSRHTGTDFAGAVGAPVQAPARGVVALVDDFYLGGGVIYIDHGAGLVTGYLHLSGKDVAEGDVVEAGQVIGRVGATGRVTGPHLHWIVRYGGHTVDGTSLLAQPSHVSPKAAGS
jgi:murein DD-endopeptidase MepM/ murein hydrolase activator NlpD